MQWRRYHTNAPLRCSSYYSCLLQHFDGCSHLIFQSSSSSPCSISLSDSNSSTFPPIISQFLSFSLITGTPALQHFPYFSVQSADPWHLPEWSPDGGLGASIQLHYRGSIFSDRARKGKHWLSIFLCKSGNSDGRFFP